MDADLLAKIKAGTDTAADMKLANLGYQKLLQDILTGVPGAAANAPPHMMQHIPPQMKALRETIQMLVDMGKMPQFAYHGTDARLLPSIAQSGLTARNPEWSSQSPTAVFFSHDVREAQMKANESARQTKAGLPEGQRSIHRWPTKAWGEPWLGSSGGAMQESMTKQARELAAEFRAEGKPMQNLDPRNAAVLRTKTGNILPHGKSVRNYREHIQELLKQLQEELRGHRGGVWSPDQRQQLKASGQYIPMKAMPKVVHHPYELVSAGEHPAKDLQVNLAKRGGGSKWHNLTPKTAARAAGGGAMGALLMALLMQMSQGDSDAS